MKLLGISKVNVRLVFVLVAILALILTATASAVVPGTNTVLSKDTTGTAGNGHSLHADTSSDGRYTAFHSFASDLVIGDTNGKADVFMRDNSTGTTVRVSLTASGAEGTMHDSLQAVISSSGRYVAFSSQATNLFGSYTLSHSQVFLKDLTTGTLTPVSDVSGAPANNNSQVGAVSDDGKYVLFSSAASNLVAGDTNGVNDIFLKNMADGSVKLISQTSNTLGNGVSTLPSMSCDAGIIAFYSLADNLVTGDTNATSDIIVYDNIDNTFKNITMSGNANSEYPDVSCDGGYIAFQSAASNLVAGDTNGQPDVFLYNRIENTTSRVSENSLGIEGDAGGDTPSVSNHGRYVAFNSYSSNLDSGDTNLRVDVFMKDMVSGASQVVSKKSTGAYGSNHSGSASISADGKVVVYSSRATYLEPGFLNAIYSDIIYSLTGY